MNEKEIDTRQVLIGLFEEIESMQVRDELRLTVDKTKVFVVKRVR